MALRAAMVRSTDPPAAGGLTRRRAGVGQRARDERRGEGEQEGGNQGPLDETPGAAGGDHLVAFRSTRQGVDVPVGGQVCGNHPPAWMPAAACSGGTGGGELEASWVRRASWWPPRYATGQQLLTTIGRGDGAGGQSVTTATFSDQRTVASLACGSRRGLGDLGQDGGAPSAVGQVASGLLGPPGGVQRSGHRLSQVTHEAPGGQEPAEGVQVGLAGAESAGRPHGPWPSGHRASTARPGAKAGVTDLSIRCTELGVQGRLRRSPGTGRPGSSASAATVAFSASPRASRRVWVVVARINWSCGDALGEGVQGRVDHQPPATAGTRLGDAHTVKRARPGRRSRDEGSPRRQHWSRPRSPGRPGPCRASRRSSCAPGTGRRSRGDPAPPQSPGAGDAVGDTGGAHAGGPGAGPASMRMAR